MIVTHAIAPTPEQLQAFLNSDFEGPVCMVNLLRFKAKAEYADGRETDLSGAEAYGLYGAQMIPFVTSKGGRLVFGSQVSHLMLGEVEDLWDSVGIVEYPSKQTFVEIVSAPEVQEFGIHRAAGLAGQLLIATAEGGLGR